jgi:hypothetical protein
VLLGARGLGPWGIVLGYAEPFTYWGSGIGIGIGVDLGSGYVLIFLQAKYAVRLLQEDGVDAAYVAHPSFVDAEELAAIKRPLSIAAAGEFSLLRCVLYCSRRLMLFRNRLHLPN